MGTLPHPFPLPDVTLPPVANSDVTEGWLAKCAAALGAVGRDMWPDMPQARAAAEMLRRTTWKRSVDIKVAHNLTICPASNFGYVLSHRRTGSAVDRRFEGEPVIYSLFVSDTQVFWLLPD